MPSIRDEFGRILDLRWCLARDRCASQPICALRVGPNRGKTLKSCPFKNEGIPEVRMRLTKPFQSSLRLRVAQPILEVQPKCDILPLRKVGLDGNLLAALTGFAFAER